ncbi:hypothetical protein GCM10011348_04750 [Marinobacterium nitratireducens]|uniref:Uncharacterized protein n=1 Tax=Marinobacterium nitratireducens TaxID=518897 RepID=A0A917Z7D5_9GAMM|nr:transcriptional regulator [Marinobacterium nitratireducens]GGO76766.1 hypothetical protein GCM10011348_04750 [Marinobacterium nitratireducens]
MKVKVTDVEAIGHIARLARKRQHIRQDDLGVMIECSHKFVGDVEKGKPTVECGRVLRLLAELGIEVHLDLPEDVAEAWQESLTNNA